MLLSKGKFYEFHKERIVSRPGARPGLAKLPGLEVGPEIHRADAIQRLRLKGDSLTEHPRASGCQEPGSRCLSRAKFPRRLQASSFPRPAVRRPTVVRTSIFRTSTRAAYIRTMLAAWDMCSLENEEKDSAPRGSVSWNVFPIRAATMIGPGSAPLIQTQRFFSPTTMPATAWRAPFYWHEPASTSLVGCASRTQSALRSLVLDGRMVCDGLFNRCARLCLGPTDIAVKVQALRLAVPRRATIALLCRCKSSEHSSFSSHVTRFEAPGLASAPARFVCARRHRL